MKMIQDPSEGDSTKGNATHNGYTRMVEPGDAFKGSKQANEIWIAEQLRKSTHIISIEHAMRGGNSAAQWVRARTNSESPCWCPSKNASGHAPIYAVRTPTNKMETESRCLCIYDNIPVASSKFFYRQDEHRPLLCWKDDESSSAAEQIFVSSDKNAKSNDPRYVDPIPPCKIATRQ